MTPDKISDPGPGGVKTPEIYFGPDPGGVNRGRDPGGVKPGSTSFDPDPRKTLANFKKNPKVGFSIFLLTVSLFCMD